MRLSGLTPVGIAFIFLAGCGPTPPPTQAPPNPAGALIGRITMANGKPAPTTAVIVLHPLAGGSEYTPVGGYVEEDGRYYFRGIKPGSYRMAISIPNEQGSGDVLKGTYSDKSSPIQIVAKDTSKDGVDQIYDVQLK